MVWTEGQAKGDAILSQMILEGLDLIPVSFTGVTMPYLAAGTEANPSTQRVFSPAVASMRFEDRLVFLAWDADCMTNRSVRDALVATGTLLVDAGAEVRVVLVPSLNGDAQAGIDDHIAHHRATGATPLADLLRDAIPLTEFERLTRVYEHTDLGRADRLVDELRHRGDLRWNPVRRAWMRYEGGVWADDLTAEVMRVAVECSRRDTTDTGGRAARAFKAAAETATHATGLIIHEGELDRDGNLFCVANGVVDLLTAELMPHDPTHLMTKASPFSYQPDAQAPVWEAALNRAFKGDHETISWFQRWAGSTLYGIVREEKLLLANGAGANGKTTLLNAIMRVMGGYATTLQPEFLTGDATRDQWADLHKVRLAVMSETNDGDTINSSVLKRVAGRDVITARRLYQQSFTFMPTHSTVLMTNFRPRVTGQDEGTWRRMLLLPFEVRIADHEKDPDIDSRLDAEGEGILAWMVKGALDYANAGFILGTCPTMDEATRGYRGEQDIIGQWVSENLITDGEKLRVPRAALYSDYKDWASASGRHPVSVQRLTEILMERGLIERSGAITKIKGHMTVRGIGLADRQGVEF